MLPLRSPGIACYGERVQRGTVFRSLSFNFGPVAFKKPHQDYKNLSWGWCAVTSFGNYDHTKGGHLILWDFKIAIQFPPHSTIFIPSAILEHSNSMIQEGETRGAITQYNSAGIVRWVAYGSLPKWYAEEIGKKPAEWWANPRHTFSRFNFSDLSSRTICTPVINFVTAF